jgi:hypothetical protein
MRSVDEERADWDGENNDSSLSRALKGSGIFWVTDGHEALHCQGNQHHCPDPCVNQSVIQNVILMIQITVTNTFCNYATLNCT